MSDYIETIGCFDIVLDPYNGITVEKIQCQITV